MLLDKTAILTEGKLKTEDVPLGAGHVRVSELSGVDYISIYNDDRFKTNDEVDMIKFTPALLMCCIVDEQGEKLFSDDDLPALSKLASGPFFKIAQVAKKLNGLSGEEVKNSEASQTNSSCIDCACTSDTDTPTNSPEA